MHRPRFLGVQSPKDHDQEVASSQPDVARLLHEIDAGLATIEATLADLERESTQHRHHLEAISGTARLFDAAGLASEATAMHEGEQTIATAISANELRRAELTETALKLRSAREQLAPPRIDVVAELTAAAARREQSQEVQAGQHENRPIAERPALRDNQDTVRVTPPAAPLQQPDTASRPPVVPEPVIDVSEHEHSTSDSDDRPAIGAADDSSGRWREPIIFGVVLLILFGGGSYLIASLFGRQEDDDSSPRSIIPAAVATDVQSPVGMSSNSAPPTPSVGAALIDPAPVTTEMPVVMMSPTPPMPTPTVTSVPTIVPTMTATPLTPTTVPATQPTALDLETVVERVIDAESALQSGQIDASMEYPDGARATSRILFELGAPGGTARAAITTMYQNGDQTRTTDLIMVGSQVWERVDGSNWQEVSNIEGGWGQVQVFLPRIASVVDPERGSDDQPGALHWYDSGRNADVQLQVDPESGVPAQMRQVSRDTGNVLTVVYTSWNVPVQIDPPAIQ